MIKDIPVMRLDDFSDIIEVRFTDKMRDRLKAFFPMTNNHPYRRIAKRLFTVWSHSGSKGRIDKPHKPYVPCRWVREIAVYTRIPFEELERDIISARAGYSNKTEVIFPQGFPLKPTEDHAWLLGLFFSSGGLHNRSRGRSRYPIGRAIRFSVSDPMIEKLIEIGKRIGDVPHIYDPNTGVRDGLPRRTGIGNKRRRSATFHTVTVEVLVKFGLPTYSIPIKEEYGWDNKRGRVYSLRNIGLKLPEWITENERFMHAFVEGYINGQKTASWAYSKSQRNNRVVESHVQIRAAGMEENQTLNFLRKITDFLRKLGIDGKIRPLCYPNTRLTCWYAYEIWKLDSLVKLFDSFEILKPDLRARLFLVKHRNPLILKIQQELDNLSNVILGLILEKPRTFMEIMNLLRLSEKQTEKVLQNLLKNGILQLDRDRYFVKIAFFNPSLSSNFKITRLQPTEMEVNI